MNTTHFSVDEPNVTGLLFQYIWCQVYERHECFKDNYFKSEMRTWFVPPLELGSFPSKESRKAVQPMLIWMLIFFTRPHKVPTIIVFHSAQADLPASEYLSGMAVATHCLTSGWTC